MIGIVKDIEQNLHAESLALLERMAARPAIRNFDGAACDSLFAIVEFYPQYANLYFFDGSHSVNNSKKPIAEICIVYNRGVTLRGPEGVPTYCSLFARIPGDWKYDWLPFRETCRKARLEGPQLLRVERVEP